MKKPALVLFASIFLSMGMHAQFIFNATGAGYLAESGLMAGGGFGMEIVWDSMFSYSDDELTCFTMDCEFLSVPDSATVLDASAFIMPLVLKERIIAGEAFCYNLGLGTGLFMLSGDFLDSYGDWWYDSIIGLPVFGEAGCQWWLDGPWVLTACLRGGAVFTDGATYPFVGFSARLGLYLDL